MAVYIPYCCVVLAWLSVADVLERMLHISRGSIVGRGSLSALALGPQSPHWSPQLPVPVQVLEIGQLFIFCWHRGKPV